MKRQIIVTGGTGYIGSHTVVELQQKGYEVIILDNLSNSSEEFVDRIQRITQIRPSFYQIDITDTQSTIEVFKKYPNIEGLIHFAALKAVGESVGYPLKYYQNNIQGLLSIIQCMKVCGIPNIIFSSSATVYGQPQILPATENTPVQEATSPYGATKQMGEIILRDFIASEENYGCISLRYFNPIGAHASGHIGELPQGVPANLMPYITQTAAGIRERLYVFGSDYNTKDGTAIRDYIHVVDLAQAHVIALERLLAKQSQAGYEVYNLGTGIGYTVLDVVESFQRTTGIEIPKELVDRRSGDVEAIYASTTKANEVLGWKAKMSLDDMTRSHWQWEKGYRGL